MDRKFYEEPTIVVLRLENEVWFEKTDLSMEWGEEGETGGGSGDFDPWA